MIRPEKTEAALAALHRILVQARWLAHEAGAADVALLLDAAEVLPSYLTEDEDLTEAFRQTLADIANDYASCATSLHTSICPNQLPSSRPKKPPSRCTRAHVVPLLAEFYTMRSPRPARASANTPERNRRRWARPAYDRRSKMP